MRRDSRIRGWALSACLGAVLAAKAVGAQCVAPTALVSGAVTTASTTPQPYSFNQSTGQYTAVAVRPAAGSDWNIDVYQSQAAFPTCLATVLGSSARTTGVDFVIGDFRTGHNTAGFYYPQVTQVGGAGTATVEWDDGANVILVNDPLLSRSTGASDVIEVWDVALNAGSLYTFTFNPVGANLKLLLFKSGAGTYWAGRDSKIFEVTGTTTYTVPAGASGFYGLVVINDDGAAGSYTLGLGRCENPTALISGVTPTPTTKAEAYYSLDQPNDFVWAAVGVRGTSDWNIDVYGSGGGGTYPVCFGSPLASSAMAPPNADFVVGNFSNLTVNKGTYYVRTHLNQDLGSGSGTVEWDDGLDFVEAGVAGAPTPAITRSTGPTDVLECWDVELNQGTQYQFFLTSTGPAVKLFLFSPTLAWGSRVDAVLQVSAGTMAVPYVPTSTGPHGLVVVNEDGGSGSYSLRVFSLGAVAVDAGPPTATEFTGFTPNPAHGPGQIRFALRQPGNVGFEVIDAAGRRVSRVPERAWSPGYWSVAWDGRGSDGARLRPGVYFVRMRVNDQPIALRKIALLN